MKEANASKRILAVALEKMLKATIKNASKKPL